MPRSIPGWPVLAGLGLLTATLALAGPVGTSLQVNRPLVATGAGSSAGGAYRHLGTAGQIGAGRTAGGQYTVHGGFHARSTQTATAVEPETPPTPLDYELEQNRPNPFNPRTTIAFALPEARRALLTLHDLRGRRVRTLLDASLPAGRHEVVLDGEGLASGIYWYRLQAGSFVQNRKLVLVK